MKKYKSRANDPRRATMTLAARTARRATLTLLMAVMALAAQTARAQEIKTITDTNGDLMLTESGDYQVTGNVTITGDLIIRGCAVTIIFPDISSSLTVGGKVIIQPDGGGTLVFSGRVLVCNNFDAFSASPKMVESIIENQSYDINNVSTDGEVSDLSGKTFTTIGDSRLLKATDGNIKVNGRTADFNWNDGEDDYYCFVAEGNDDVYLEWFGELWVEAFNKDGNARFTVKDGDGGAVIVTYDYEADSNEDEGGHSGEASFTMPANDDVTVSVRVCVPVTYVDGDGDTKVCREYTVLPKEGNGPFYGGGEHGSGWYVSNGATVNGITLSFEDDSDVHLILCDGTTTSISNGDSPLSCGNLTIYGQSGGTGALTLSSSNWAINVSYGHDLTICGGHVSATSTGFVAINLAEGDLIVNGGTLTACASNGESNAISIPFGTLKLSGGTVEATTGAISAGNGATIASGLQYTDGSSAYSTSITSDDLEALGAVTLTLTPSVTLDGTGDTGISGDLTALDGKMAKMALTRTFPAGKKQTVCLPFDPSALLSKGQVWAFTGISEGKAVMTEVIDAASLKANTPYIFQASSEVTSIDFGSVVISIGSDPKTEDVTAGFTFHGTYEKKHWDATDDDVKNGHIYGFLMNDSEDEESRKQGMFVQAKYNTNVRPFSCYLEYSGGNLTDIQQTTARRKSAEQLPDVIEIVWKSAAAPGETTGIDELSIENLELRDSHDAWFDLSGRRLSGQPSAKGIYIHNGSKKIIK